jgi:hypothetical protein
MKHPKIWITVIVALISAVIGVIVTILVAVPLTSDAVRHRTVRTLSDRLDADVAIGDLHWHVFPTLHAEGTDLTVRRRRHTDPLPLIAIKRFTVNAGVAGILRSHIARVAVDGLVINIMPDDDKGHRDAEKHAADPNAPESSDAGELPVGRDVVIDTLQTTDAQVVIVPRTPKKDPKIWAIHSLTMHDVGADLAMPFTATLTNAVPPGEIETTGTFGPWQRENPDRTALAGTFTFAKADLSVFSGIAGTLSAHGKFGGVLGRIVVDGETDTPNFTVELSGHPFALHTAYRATVDGTSGNTDLDRIDGKFLQSTLIAKGSVIDGPPGEHGRTVSLDVTLDPARIEDVLTMAVRPAPPMHGALKLTTKFLLPPGRSDVADRLRLNGQFAVARVRFMNYDVQQKIEELSHRSRGLKTDERQEHVVSDFQGRFILGNGRLDLPSVSFSVPGANVQLAGRYALKPETLDFRGSLNMSAKVSDTQTGIKSLLLKVVDPLFHRRGGGSAIPIRVTGTRNAPNFGIDMGRVFKRGDSR